MNAVCFECNRDRHSRCRRPSCRCFCRWPSYKPTEDRLLVGCWCEGHMFNVPADLVRRGETISCGDECQKVSA